jgi:enoyl-CoA hydratase
MGFYNALNACFSLHQINHAHWAEVTAGQTIIGTPDHGVEDWKSATPVHERQVDSPW